MFYRTELELKTLQELKELSSRYGIKPIGNPGYKTSYISGLLAFPGIALRQIKEGEGIKKIHFRIYQCLNEGLDQMREPTPEQAALIKLGLEEKFLKYPEKYQQEELLNLYKAKLHLEAALSLMNT